jgi:hypothetical protein
MTRIPEGLRRKLEREAEQNRRSMNAEIVHRLTQSFVNQDLTGEIVTAVRQTVVDALQAQTPLALREASAQRAGEAGEQIKEPKPTTETEM